VEEEEEEEEDRGLVGFGPTVTERRTEREGAKEGGREMEP
jgi:hypothetical protein